MKITKEKIAILNELGRKNFLSILDKFGIDYSDRGRYVNATCPIPSHPSNADNPTAFSFDFDRGKWACWTCIVKISLEEILSDLSVVCLKRICLLLLNG